MTRVYVTRWEVGARRIDEFAGHLDQDFGSVTPGKYADMILVNGDPAKQMSDIGHVDTVIKNGVVYKPAELYPAFGIRRE